MPAAGARSIAKAAGLDRYFTGKPCSHGHITERYVSNKMCLGCAAGAREARKEANREYAKDWYTKNRERVLEARRARNPAKGVLSTEVTSALADRGILYGADNYYAEYSREHYRLRKQQYRCRDRARRAALRGNGGRHTKQDVEAMMTQQNGLCNYCGVGLSEGYHVDHVVPIKLGGSNDSGNLQLLCPLCNRRKGAKRPEAFEATLERNTETL